MKIQVTQKDIDNGEQNNLSSCPIANSIKRTRKVPVFVFRDGILIYNQYGDVSRQYTLPNIARNFIRKFDMYGKNGKSVKPFEFELP